MTKKLVGLLVATVFAMTWPGGAGAVELTIYEVQYTDDPAGDSPYYTPDDPQLIDCAGGIVVHKFDGWTPKLTLYDPGSPDGWGGIVAKDWTDRNLFDHVAVGDWISFTQVEVEEYRGNTVLMYDAGSGFAVQGSGNVPDPIVVSLHEIAAPLEDSGDWYVEDDSAEKYEAMWLKVEGATVTAMDLGKASDNYNLHNLEGDAWVSDYMNEDLDGEIYLPQVSLGVELLSVTGILEQYTKLRSGWDYYQLLTTIAEDVVAVSGPIPGDANLDGRVTDADAAILATNWQMSSGATWANGDFSGDGAVTDSDAAILATHWQEGVEGQPATVPEPAAIISLITGLAAIGLGLARRNGQ